MLAAQDRSSVESEIDPRFADLCYGIAIAPLPNGGLRVEGSACCTDPLAGGSWERSLVIAVLRERGLA